VEETGKLVVIKKDGRRVPYDRNKIYGGIQRACWKRPVGHDQIEAVVNDVEEELFRTFDREVDSAWIGNAVAGRIRKIDKIAYLRFASSHHQLDIDQLIEEARDIKERDRTDAPGQQDLFHD
jgi:transcriptional repressor NrdR